MRCSSWVLTLGCLSVATALASQSAWAVDWKAKVDPLAQPLIDDNVAVGFIVGIVKDGKTQTFSYGETEKGSGKRPAKDTVYEIGSISKVFTGILLADLVERGVVKLDDPVQSCLPTVNVPLNHDKPVTLLHLATHTSGLPRLPDNLKPSNPADPYADYTAEDMYAFLSDYKFKQPLGKPEYSNYGMALLGQALAEREQTTYEQLLIERIAKPLRMRDTTITLNDNQKKRLALPYDAALAPNSTWNLSVFAGAGAIRSTCNDMLLFARANLENKTTPVHKAMKLAQQKRELGSGVESGLGWATIPNGYWHNGMTGGYHSFIGLVPKQNTAVVVLANTATMEITNFGMQLMQIANGESATPSKRRKAIDVARDVLEKYTGFYAVTPQFGVDVTLGEDGNLYVQATGQQKLSMRAESESKFFLTVVDAQIRFVTDEKGQVNELILYQNGQEIKATRKK